MSYTLQMVFETIIGEQITYSISDVRTDLTQDEISTFMDFIITNDAITTSKGKVTKTVKATVVQKTQTSFNFTE